MKDFARHVFNPRFAFALLVLLIAALAIFSVPERVFAATLPSGFVESQYGTTLSAPTAMDIAPDGRIFVAQQSGSLRVIKNGSTLTTPFVSISVDSRGERGLLGVTFDPAFATDPERQFVYVYYTVPSDPPHNRVSRFTANGDVAQANSETILLDLNDLSSAENHNGGAIHFGPDGKLYVAVGENANASNSQTLNNLLGKILRINADGTIPADNSFYNTATGNNRAIWALGLRNPFTFDFERGTGRMFINDVGAGTREEINDGIAGSNYGWNRCEGPCSPANPLYRDPLFDYPHGNGTGSGCAITGGAFYDPSPIQFPNEYRGDYFFADLCNGWISRYDPVTDSSQLFATGISQPVDLKVGADGSLYYLARGSGIVYRVQYTLPLPSITSTLTATATRTHTNTATPTRTQTNTSSPTPRDTPTATDTVEPTSTHTATPTPTLTNTPEGPPTPALSPTNSVTPRPPRFIEHDTSLHIDYGGWRGIQDPSASGGSYRASCEDNPINALNDASFTFRGTSITWGYLKGPSMGSARVLIDGSEMGEFCQYAPDMQYNATQTFDGLAEGKHKILIRVTGDACGGNDSNVSLDYFVTGQGVVESTASEIIWSSWKTRFNPGARRGMFRFSKASGARVQLRFHGTGVRAMTLSSPMFGQVEVAIDGAVIDTIDLNNPSFTRAALKFKNLTDGDHTIVLTNVGVVSKIGLPVDGFRGSVVIAPTLD